MKIRTYRLWYVLDVSYDNDEPGELEDAIAYGNALERRQRGEEVVLMKAEELEGVKLK